MVEIRDQIERRPIGSLIPYARNSRTHSDAQIQQLAASMREWGWTNHVLVDEVGGIIAGHGRVLAAQRLQISEVPVIVASGWTDFRGACVDVGLRVRQCLIWKKHAMVLGRQDYHWLHEPCLYGWKDGAGHLWASDRKQTTVLEFDRPMRNADHPTMKPVALIEYQLLNNTKGGDVLLDSFGGSGTALIAAEKNGRIARLMEIDPRYCDVIVRRWQDFTGQQAQLESTSQSWGYVATERAQA